MTKILGIDTGTNSLGWAIVEKNADDYHLLEKGVNIFQEGVKIEKGIESSKAAERTAHKAARVRNYRIKLRKIRLLRILSDAHLCHRFLKQNYQHGDSRKSILRMSYLCNGKLLMMIQKRLLMHIDTYAFMRIWISAA